MSTRLAVACVTLALLVSLQMELTQAGLLRNLFRANKAQPVQQVQVSLPVMGAVIRRRRAA